MTQNTDRVTESAKAVASAADSVGQIAGAIKWTAILVVTVVVCFVGYKGYSLVTNIGGAVIDAGAAVVDAGVDGVTGVIERTGEAAVAVRESVGTAVDTAMEGVDTDAISGAAGSAAKAADGAVDNTLNWIQKRRDQLGNALDGDEDTSVNSVDSN